MQNATIGRLNYQIGADTGDLRRDTKLSRSEISQVRRAMNESKSSAEQLAEKQAVLQRAMQTGAISAADYVDTMTRLAAKTPEATAAQKRLDDELRKGEQITKSMMTAEERREVGVRELKQLLDNQTISQETYTRAVAKLDSEMPGAVEAQARMNRELQAAAQITNRVTNAEERYGQETAELRRHLAEGRISQETYNRALQQARARLPEVQAAERARTASMERAERWTRQLENSTEKYQRELRELSVALRRGEISQDLYARGVRRAAEEQRKASRPTAGPGMMSRAGTYVAGGLMAAGALAVGTAFRGMVRRNEEFQQSMYSSLAIAGDVPEAMRQNLTRAAQQIAYHTKFSAAEAASSIQYLQLAGYSLEKSLATMPLMAQFAQAGMFDLATATDLATDAQASLGLGSENTAEHLQNMQRVTDVLARGSTIANATIEQFATAITNGAGPAAKMVGMEVEETTAVLAAMASTGFAKGEEAGTQFGILMRDLTTKFIANKDAFQAAGVAVFDSAGSFNHTADIIAGLETRLAGLSDEEKKSQLLALGFSDKSAKTITAMIGQSEAIREYEDGLTGIGGTVQDVAERQIPPLTAALQKMQAMWDLFTQTVADPIIVDAAGASGELGFFGETLALIADTTDVLGLAWDYVSLTISRTTLGLRETVGILVDMGATIAQFTGMEWTTPEWAKDFVSETWEQREEFAKQEEEFNKRMLQPSSGDQFRIGMRQIQADLAAANEPPPDPAQSFVGPLMSDQMRAEREVRELERQEREAEIAAAKERGERLTEAMMTPAERLAEELAGLENDFQLGGMSDETYRRAREDAQNRFGDKPKAVETQQGAPTTAGRGTAEAYKMIVDAMRKQADAKPEDKIVAATDRVTDQLQGVNDRIDAFGDVFGSVS